MEGNYYLLGYYQPVNKIYLMDKAFRLISYTLPLSFVNYQMAILKKDYERADKVNILNNLVISNSSPRISGKSNKIPRKV